MRKVRMIKRFVAFVLCMMIAFEDNAFIYAADVAMTFATESTEIIESTEETEEVEIEESSEASEESDGSSIGDESTEEEQNNEVETTESTESTESEEESETTEIILEEDVPMAALAEEVEDNLVVTSEATSDGVVVTMEGPVTSFPAGSNYELKVSQLVNDDSIEKVVDNCEESIVEYVAYDINLYVDGVITEPTGDVTVTFEGDVLVADNADEEVAVYHVDGEELVEMPTGEITDEVVEMTTNHFSVYLIGIKGSANNASAIVQDNEYVEVRSENNPKKQNGSYSYYMGNDISENKCYMRVQVVYGNETKAYAPERYNEYAYFRYDKESQRFTINPADGYEIDKVELVVVEEQEGNLNTNSTPLENVDGKYTCTLQKRNSNAWNQKKYTNTLKITLKDTNVISTTENFKANFFDYHTPDKINEASSKLNSSRYLKIGTGNGSWNSCHYDGVYQGLAGASLTDGMITFPNYGAADFFTSVGKQEITEFYSDEGEDKNSYYNVTLPFEKIGDDYILDSSKVSVLLDTNTGDVSLDEKNSGFWPFGEYNYYFGMNFTTDFYMTSDGTYNGNDIVFDFSGDDDVWVFVDGKLILDLGGIHGAVGGTINFSTGDVKFYDAAIDASQYGVITTDTKQDYITIDATGTKDNKTYISAASYNIYDYAGNGVTKENLLDGDKHELQVYYMERGAGASNCKIKFNLPQTPQQNTLKVTNTVKTTINDEKIDDDTPFTYVIKKDDDVVANASYTCKKADGTSEVLTTDENGEFTLKNGEYALFASPEAGKYTVTEKLQTEYASSYVAKKNDEQTAADGPVSATQENLTATHQIVVEMNKKGDLYQIDFVNERSTKEIYSFDLDKTAKLVDWDARTYDITLTASSTTERTTGGTTTITTEKAKMDVVLVLDVSASMNDKDNGKSRLAYLKEATINFVNEFGKNAHLDSKLAIVTFNTEASTLVELTNVTDANKDDIIKKINAINADGGTNQNKGLKVAQSVLSSCQNENKYVILFTDGQPDTVGGTTEDETPIASDAYDCANEIKKTATVYTVRLGDLSGGSVSYGKYEYQYLYEHKFFGITIWEEWRTATAYTYNERTYAQWLTDLASSPEQALAIANASEINTILKQISNTITSPIVTENVDITGVTVQDTIDARFELTEETRKILESTDNVTIVPNEDGTTTIIWKNQTLKVETGAEDGTVIPGWSQVLRVKAKDDYIGGNAVTTNVNPGSFVELKDGTKEEFNQPKVNVKAEVSINEGSDEIFLGESLEQYFTSEKAKVMIGEIANIKTYGDSKVKITWKNELDEVVEEDDIRKAKPEESVTYKLEVNVEFNVKKDSEEAKNAAIEMKNADEELNVAEDITLTKSYTVTVKTGTITITKKINQASYKADEGNPIFTFKITNLIDNKVYYRTVRFDVDDSDTKVCTDKVTEENHLFSKDYYVCSAKITDLPQGLYKVEEMDTMGFSLDAVGTDDARTNCKYLNQETTTLYAIGYTLKDNVKSLSEHTDVLKSEPNDGHLECDRASTIFVNKKTRKPAKLTDTDVVKNSLVIGNEYKGNKDADNEKISATGNEEQ